MVRDELNAIDGFVHFRAVVPGVGRAAEALLEGAGAEFGDAAGVCRTRGWRAVNPTRAQRCRF